MLLEAKSISGSSLRRQIMAASRQSAIEVGADEAVSDVGQVGQTHVGGQRHAAAVDLEDLAPAVAVGDRDGDLAVEPARAAAGAGSRTLGRLVAAMHDHVLPLGQPVHQGQQLGHDPLLDVADDLLALRRDGVDLVEEDDAGGLARGLVEDLAEVGFALAVELVDDLRSVHGEEPRVGLVGHGAGDQGLSAAGRAVEQHPLGWVDPQPLEDLRIAERQLDDLANPVQLALQAADIFVRERLTGVLRPRLLDLGRPAGPRDLQDRLEA